MNITLSFFADENISTDLINWIRENGYNISGVKEEKIYGATDIEIIQKCFASNEIILTHDNDFGKIILQELSRFIRLSILDPDILMPAFISQL
jgi:predicted nuclease of predicted toxin-antitoxin system